MLTRGKAVEAIGGGISAPELARTMGNMLATSNILFETYVPAG